MRLDEYLDDFEIDMEAKKRDLAEKKSYEILNHIDGINNQLDPIRGETHVGRAAPEIFVGRSGYPNINTGILAPTDPDSDAAAHKTSGEWYDRGLGIGNVMQYRTGLLNSQHSGEVNVHDTWSGFIGTQREVAIAQDPVGIEMDLATTPNIDVTLDDVSAPTGPRARATNATLTENPYVPRPVKKTLEDDDWNATGAMTYLYNRGFDVYDINTILSAGALGQTEQRRLVPTRWSITAVDDTVGQFLHGQIRNSPSIDEVEVHEQTYMGNRYWVVLAPGTWEYELVEMKSPGSVWNPDASGDIWLQAAHEGFEGRTQYVEETSGAYYAARVGVLEYLADRDRQAKALVLREVSDDYWAPVGVWQIRESVRNAFSDEYATAETFHDAVNQLMPVLPASQPTLQRKSHLISGVQSVLNSFT